MRRGRIKVKKPPVTLRDAPEVAVIARELIHAHHKHLIDVRVDCAFRSETQKTAGREVYGTCSKTTIREEYLGRIKRDAATNQFLPAQHYFVIAISEPAWKVLTPEQRTALVDHELCHAGVVEEDDGTKRLKIIRHDLEDFVACVRRNGLWSDGVRQYAKAASPHVQQLELDIAPSRNGHEAGRPMQLVDTRSGEVLETTGEAA